MKGFHSTFVGFDVDSEILLKSLEPYFINYNYSKWEVGGGGAIQYSDVKFEYSLICVASRQYGLLLEWNVWNVNESKNVNSFYSVGDRSNVEKIEDVGDDEFYPAGCFVDPAVAWMAVEDFFCDPTKKSTRLEWVNVEDIPWPES